MSENSSFYQGLWTLGLFLVISTLVMGTSIVLLVASNDYIFYNVYEATENMVDIGVLGSDTLTFIENATDKVMEVLKYIDFFWVIMFLVFVIDYFKNCYYSRREGYFSVFGFISFGMMAILFLLNLLVTYNNSIYDIFFNKILGDVSLNLTFFDFYIQYFQQINLFLIVVGLIINFIPFDFQVFNKRKDNDLQEVTG